MNFLETVGFTTLSFFRLPVRTSTRAAYSKQKPRTTALPNFQRYQLCSMKKIFFLLALSVFVIGTINARPHVYDCFTFFNEIELLKMRLEELNEYVDYFVLVESVETQRGKPKPLYFVENADLFKKYQSKIIHVAITEMHPKMGLWEREHFQRNAISRGLTHCAKEDIIMISDLDEIPRPEKIPLLCELLSRRNYRTLAFVQELFRYQLNRPVPSEKWRGTTATTYGNFKKHSTQHFRDRRWAYYAIPNGGWHFSWMGGIQKVRQKNASIVESDIRMEYTADTELAAHIASIPVIPITKNRFPKYVCQNEAYLKSIGWIAEVDIEK
jgi:beta-1,4-mannosyl-glycoprotein beta-1,4-N-acetylglucosaminyltransferase